jgi:DDE superfamily endonuclease
MHNYRVYYRVPIIVEVDCNMLVGFAVVAALLLLRQTHGHPLMQHANFLVVACALVASLEPELLGLHEKRVGHVHRTRNRKYVNDIFNEMGPHYVRRAYRMEPASFWKLCRLLRPLLLKKSNKKKNRNGAKNGIIPTPTKISAAIRYFAGGSPYDISVVHGISHTEVFRCVWAVVDAINACDDLKFQYPSEHDEQQKIANGFAVTSRGIFNCCAGAIDGILIWIERPSGHHCEISECAAKKFYCGRKKKFGLNMQATCDHNKKFLDIYLGHPASTSDYLAFSSSPLYCKLEQKGFMKPGLCIFGDNAYVNTLYMATPYKSVRDGAKDAYNFFHSNCRITIECAFGMLVHRWGILCKPMSTKLPIAKVTSMVRALCRLHNFCIDERLLRIEASPRSTIMSPAEQVDVEIADHLDSDNINIILGGGSSLVDGNENFSPEALLHGGEHFDDVSRGVRISRKAVGESLPREVMCGIVERSGLRRPTPNTWVGLKVANANG